jgi:energy-coupling factor transporter ATP-binding protein EcfA2
MPQMKKTKSTQEQNEFQQIIYFRIFNNESIIRNQDFNFGGKYQIIYNSEKKSLEIYLNENYIENFFYDTEIENAETAKGNDTVKKGRISNITAIVGENGSGKTTLIKEITGIFTDSLYNDSNSFILGILINENTIRFYYQNINDHTEIKNTNQNLHIEIVPKIRNTNKESYNSKSPILDKENFRIAFYNNYIEPKHLGGFGQPNMINLGLEFTLWNIEEHKGDNQKRKITNLLKDLELIQIIKFISSKKSNLDKVINIPKSLDIKSYKYTYLIERFKDRISKSEKLNHNQQVFFHSFYSKIVEQAQNINFEGTKLKKFKEKFIVSTHLQWLENYLIYFSGISDSIEIDNEFQGLEFQEFCTYIYNLVDQLNTNHPVIGKPIMDLEKGFPRINDYTQYIQQNIDKIFPEDGYYTNNLDDNMTSGFNWDIRINIQNKEVLNFLGKYFEFIEDYGFLHFDWNPPLSAGEYSLIRLFAKLNSISNIGTPQNVLLILDEAETNLHPEWQRRFIQYLVEVLPNIFIENNRKKKLNIQIILTTHSPFLLSDLPLSNVILLKKESSNQITVSSLTNHKQTFGANIHTLLADSFFMKEGLMGEFAKQKINTIIDYLLDSNNEKDSEQNINHTEKLIEYEKIIGIIGDPILKNKLFEILNEKIKRINNH